MKTSTHVSAHRKLVRLICASIVAACAYVHADVYSNVYFWSRGLATDADGDGVMDIGEGRDSLNRPEFNGFQEVRHDPRYTNEWAHLPYRGTTNLVQAIYLPQKVEITDAAAGTGSIWPCSFRLLDTIKDTLAYQEKANYTFFMRFRPDVVQPGKAFILLNAGHGTKRGIMLGCESIKEVEHKYTWNGVSRAYTNRVGKFVFYYGGSAWAPDAARMQFYLGNWNDLVLSVDGQKVRLLLSCDGHVNSFGNDYGNSSYSTSNGGLHTIYRDVSINAEYNLCPHNESKITLGGQNTKTIAQSYNAANGYNFFRGSIQMVAIWTNALMEAEMREAAAWPRMDKWRLGVEDGSADEFAAADAGAAADVEGDTWAVPALGANESVTIRFPLDASGDAKMNQFVRIKGVDGGAQASLKIFVNGTQCEDSKYVSSERFTRWFVPAELLQANATNSVVITRVDSGATPFRADVVAFGGSVQYGEQNGNTNENGLEGYNQNATYNLIGGNWFDGTRAIFGGGWSPSTQAIQFSLPEDLQGKKLDYRMELRTIYNRDTVSVIFNGQTLTEGVAGGTEIALDVPAELFQTTNLLEVKNTGTTAGSYIGLDYVRFSVQKPKGGLVLLVR